MQPIAVVPACERFWFATCSLLQIWEVRALGYGLADKATPLSHLELGLLGCMCICTYVHVYRCVGGSPPNDTSFVLAACPVRIRLPVKLRASQLKRMSLHAHCPT